MKQIKSPQFKTIDKTGKKGSKDGATDFKVRQFDGATLVIGSECFELFDQTWDVVQWVDEQRDRVHDIEGVSLNLWVVFQLIQRHRGEWFEFELIIRMSFEESSQFKFDEHTINESKLL